MSVAFVSFATLSVGLYAQSKQIKVEPIQPISTSKGVDLYRQYCAVCHGLEGRGDGPAAAALTTKATDLTQLSRHNKSQFPALHISRIIGGVDGPKAHGTSDMPMWGDAFKSVSMNPEIAQIRVNILVEYLKTLQR